MRLPSLQPLDTSLVTTDSSGGVTKGQFQLQHALVELNYDAQGEVSYSFPVLEILLS